MFRPLSLISARSSPSMKSLYRYLKLRQNNFALNGYRVSAFSFTIPYLSSSLVAGKPSAERQLRKIPLASNPINYSPTWALQRRKQKLQKQHQRQQASSSSPPPANNCNNNDDGNDDSDRFGRTTSLSPRTSQMTRKRQQQKQGLKKDRLKYQKQRKTYNSNKNNNDDTIPTSCWVQILNIPILSNLKDLLISIDNVLNVENERGIVDLDDMEKNWDEGKPLPFLPKLTQAHHGDDDTRNSNDYSSPWVLKAQTILSQRYRPMGWRIKFADRSIVHAFLTNHREHSFQLSWKNVTVSEWIPPAPEERKENNEKQQEKGSKSKTNIAKSSSSPLVSNVLPPPEKLIVSDCMVRIENCPKNMIVDHVRHILRRYDLSMTTTGGENGDEEAIMSGAICKLYSRPDDETFLVRFSNPAWARAAIRELQGLEVTLPISYQSCKKNPRQMMNNKKRILLCQYPKQIM